MIIGLHNLSSKRPKGVTEIAEDWETKVHHSTVDPTKGILARITTAPPSISISIIMSKDRQTTQYTKEEDDNGDNDDDDDNGTYVI